MRRILTLLALLPFLASATPASAAEAGDEAILAVGPSIGWTIRQIAIQPPEMNQLDLAYRFVHIGANLQLFGVREGFGARIRAGVDLFQSMSVDREDQPAGYGQHAFSAELMPTFRWSMGSLVGMVGAGIGFIHYTDGEANPEWGELELQEALLVPAQEVINIPVVLGISVNLGDVIVTPELGAAWAIHYATSAPDVREQLDNGTATAIGLDLWLRVAMEFPLL
jgi:hypothetical protein